MRIRFFAALTATVLTVVVLFTSCGGSDRPKVMCSLFPQYDFVRVIAGDKVSAVLLPKPGEKAHDYAPGALATYSIAHADVFIYTSEHMEPWAAQVAEKVRKKKGVVIEATAGIAFDHVHSDDCDHEHEDEHEHAVDPHVWTTPKNAMVMVETITKELMRIDSANAAYYRANADTYLAKLEALDAEFRQTVADAKRKTIIVADGFSLYYFIKDYQLGYLAAFSSCSGEGLPTDEVLTRIENAISLRSIPVVFYGEFSDKEAALLLAERTGTQPLLFHSCENITKAESDADASYLSLMLQNLEHLKQALY